MKQYQINLRFQMLRNVLSGAMYKMHVVAHTFLFCRSPCARNHLGRKIAKRDVMSPLRHQNCSLTFPTAGIQHAQRSVTEFSQQLVQILPEDRLTKLTFGGAINVARKLFRDVIKIAIPHWEGSTHCKTAILSHPRGE
ncbi:Uncharacterised protein [Enterobacter hormaechei]|nr:Uncharacterised protein [Enterobacter hormaechei]